MIKKYVKRLILVNKDAILMEVLTIKGLMQLLMKTRNTDGKWTRDEKKEIKRVCCRGDCMEQPPLLPAKIWMTG